MKPSAAAPDAIIAEYEVVRYNTPMSSQQYPIDTLAIVDLDPIVEERLRERAARNGRSMEAEAYAILTQAIGTTPTQTENLAEAIRRRFAPFGGVDLQHPPRGPGREPPSFDE
jgi:plasmid stability protein